MYMGNRDSSSKLPSLKLWGLSSLLLRHYACQQGTLCNLYWLCSFAPAERPLKRCCMIHQTMSQDTSNLHIIRVIIRRQNATMIGGRLALFAMLLRSC